MFKSTSCTRTVYRCMFFCLCAGWFRGWVVFCVELKCFSHVSKLHVSVHVLECLLLRAHWDRPANRDKDVVLKMDGFMCFSQASVTLNNKLLEWTYRTAVMFLSPNTVTQAANTLSYSFKVVALYSSVFQGTVLHFLVQHIMSYMQ